MFMKNFIINNEKFCFVDSGKTPLKNYKNCYDLCNTNLTIQKEELEIAIISLQTNGYYKNFIVSEYLKEREEKEKERQQKNVEYWNNVKMECEVKKNKIQQIIKQIKEYCNKNLSYILVYNKLEECIEKGYFMVFHKYQNKHIFIKLNDINICL